MFEIFTVIADGLAYAMLGLDPASRLGAAVHFFIEDTTKIFALLVVMIYVIALARASLDLERVRAYLHERHRLAGYFFGSGFGAITPFCSCSSIPLFLGFTSAGIPLGITMAFLLTSPVINEVAVVMLWGLLGWKFTLAYVAVGMAVGIIGGMLLDALRAHRWLQDFAAKAYAQAQAAAPQDGDDSEEPAPAKRLTLADRHAFARDELKEIVGRIWKWIFIGVGLGAGLHGFVPEGWFAANLGAGQWWSVPAAVLAGLPLYSNATGVIPVLESLIGKGLPVGTTLAFCMSTVAASLPEFTLLKQVMQWRLLAAVFVILLVNFTIMGWVFNGIAPWLFIGGA
ncbi:MAG: permease [Halofilum sp. (in: g-proteobacteria)]|nr:permease [Halofilum sp. (in: g-proteobacteria)]